MVFREGVSKGIRRPLRVFPEVILIISKGIYGLVSNLSFWRGKHLMYFKVKIIVVVHFLFHETTVYFAACKGEFDQSGASWILLFRQPLGLLDFFGQYSGASQKKRQDLNFGETG